MPIYTIEGPDGRRARIEADSEDLALQGAQEAFGGAVPKPQAEGGGEMSARNVLGSAVRGIPFLGGYADEARATVQSKLYGGTYEDELKRERDRHKAFAEQHPYVDTGLGLAGGIAGTVAALPLVGAAGTGGAVAATGRALLGTGAKTLPGAIGRGMVAGTAQGAAAGSGEQEGGALDRLYGGVTGGAVGGAVGGAFPVAFEGGRRALAAGARMVNPPTDPLSALSGGAQRYVGQISDPESVARIEQDLRRLGPNGMLADVSPEWNGVAQGAASRPGSRDVVVNAVNARDEGKNLRLREDLDANLGPARVPSFVEREIKAGREALGPRYEEVFQGARRVDTSALAQDLEALAVSSRGPGQDAAVQVRQMLDIRGAPGNLDPDPRTLHSTRRAIDGLMAAEKNTDALDVLRTARRRIDHELAENVPGIKDIDAQYAELFRQSEALQRGRQVLDGGKTAIHPAELREEIAEGVIPGGRMIGPGGSVLRMQEGTRAEIDRVAGTQANDPVALRSLVKGEGDWNRDKLRDLYGADRADPALAAIDREATFNNTRNQVVSGSQTGIKTAFKSFLDRVEEPSNIPGASDITGVGLLLNGAKRIGSVLTGALGRDKANRFATELARTSIATGTDRDEFVEALRRAGVQQALISRALDMATKSGLVVAREAPGQIPQEPQR